MSHKLGFIMILRLLCNLYLCLKDERVLLFCIAIQYWSPGIGIAILLGKTSNAQAIPDKFVAVRTK